LKTLVKKAPCFSAVDVIMLVCASLSPSTSSVFCSASCHG